MNILRLAVAAGVLSVASLAPVAAQAQTAVSGSEEVVVLPNTETRGNVGGVGGGEEVLGETAVRGLAVTGTDAAVLAAIGTAAVAAGAGALVVRRRRHV